MGVSNLFLHKLLLYLFCVLFTTSSLFFLPFPFFDQFEYPKFIAFGVITLLLLVINFLLSNFVLLNRLSGIVKLFLGFLVFGNLLACVFSTDVSLSFGGALFRYQGFITQFLYLSLFVSSFFFFLKSDESEQRKVFQFLGWLLLVHILVSLFSLTHLISLFDPRSFENRLFGTFGNPNYLASFMVALFPLFVYFFRQRKIILFSGSVFFLVALCLTGSRSAVLALIGSFLAMSLLWRKKFVSFFSFQTLLPLVAIFLCTLGILFFFQPQLVQRFSFRPHNFTSFSTRIDLWQAGFHLYTHHPLTGIGQDALQHSIRPYLLDRVRLNTNSYVDRLHSEPLDILVMDGPLTLVGFLGLFFFLFFSALHSEQKNTLFLFPLLCSLLGIFLYHLVNFSTITTNVLWYFLLGFLAALLSTQDFATTKTKNIHSPIGEL